MPTNTNWSRKLLALLHDPPEKAFDYSPRHEERAAKYAATAGLEEAYRQQKEADWNASAADRFVLPTGRLGFTQGVAFRHPLSGDVAELPTVEQAVAEKAIDDAFPPDHKDPRLHHWLVWRTWMQQATTTKSNLGRIPYLPADTRIPDGSIWNHVAVTSALEGTRSEDGKLAPALLLFQIGPVQEFIAQARSTRDLWSGSYLLSWLASSALQKISEDLGPDSVIFPALRGQPLYDWRNREILAASKFKTGKKESKSFAEAYGIDSREFQQLALTPSLPNRILAIVPAGYDAEAVATAVREEFETIANSCWEFFQKHQPLAADDKDMWKAQTDGFLQTSWQVWPWADIDKTAELLKSVLGVGANALERSMSAAKAIPSKHQDTRCYPHSQQAGFAWAGNFALLSHRLDARRATRDFTAWPSSGSGREHDAYSGKEEALIDADWLKGAQGVPDIRHLFRGNEKLGAINLIKRVWHLAYLAPDHELKRIREAFDSVYAVAAGSWKARLKTALHDSPDCWSKFLTFAEAAHAASGEQSVMKSVDPAPSRSGQRDEIEWLENLDAELLFPRTWDDDGVPAPAIALRDLQRTADGFLKAREDEASSRIGLGDHPVYYAVIALDGDQIGKWLSGERNPAVKDLLSDKAKDYFSKLAEAEPWLEGPRPVSPSFHLALSEAMGNFGLYCARRIVEFHHGQLIYAGGDDVLAMVPASEALSCVAGLRMAFQGDPELAEEYSSQFVDSGAEGFVQLHPDSRLDAEPSWPLLVPGPKTDVSAGIAIGHVKSPLQDLIGHAHAQEKRAKRNPQATDAPGLGRGAVSARLLKRSGEHIIWGAKHGSPGLDLLSFYSKNVAPHHPGLASRMQELLGPILDDTKPHDATTSPLIRAELNWAVNNLEGGDETSRDKAQEELPDLVKNYLTDLSGQNRPAADLVSLFAAASFLNRLNRD